MTTTTKKPDAPRAMIRAAVAPKSLSADERTVEVAFTTTGADVLRYDWSAGKLYWERLLVDEKSIDLGRLNKRAPLLNSHSSWDLRSVIGVVERAWIEGGEGRALVRFSRRPDVEPIWRDVADGILSNLSVGYDVKAWRDTDEMIDGIGVREVTGWEPLEISFVPIPADAEAQVRAFADEDHAARTAARQEQRNMAATVKPKTKRETEVNTEEEREESTDEETTSEAETEESTESTDDEERGKRAEALRAEGAKRERERQSAIRAACRKAKLGDDFAEKLVSSGVSVEKARAKIIDARADDESTEVRARVEPGANAHHEAFREHAATGLLHRSGIARTKDQSALAFASMSLLRLAEECLRREGVSTLGLSPARMAKRAMLESSDFTDIMAKHAARTLRSGYDAIPRTFTEIFRQATDIMNFKSVERIMLSDVPELQLVAEAGAYPEGDFADSKNGYLVRKYGLIIALTWEMIINDDLDGISRLPQMLGAAAARKESDIVWGLLLANGNLGDSSPIFHSTHGNASDALLDSAGLSGLRKYLRTRRSKTKAGADADHLNLSLAAIAVGPELETTAELLLTEHLPGATTRAELVPQSMRKTKLIVEPRITGTNWFGFANTAEVDTLEYGYLAGEEGVTMEEDRTFDVDDEKIKARLVFGAGVIDRKGMYWSTGDAEPEE